MLSATLLVVATAALLDTTVVVIALDELRREFGATVSVIQWVTTAYLLAMAAVIPVVGWTVGRFGARAVWTRRSRFSRPDPCCAGWLLRWKVWSSSA